MSYDNYGQAGGYRQGNPYSSDGGNPYAAQGSSPSDYGGRPHQMAPPRAQQGGYNNRYGDEEQGYGNAGNDVEMAPLNGQAGGYGGQPAGRDPNAILNECRDLDRGIETIQQKLDRLRFLQQRAVDDPDASQNTATNRELDALNSETMTLYRNLAARIKTIKSQPDSGSPRNAPQVGMVDRKLKKAIEQYQSVERDFRKKMQAQMERQYRIVRPDASDAEVREAVEDTSNQQVFTQALMQSDRRGQSQSALRAVQGRHEAIQKIESDMIQLAQLFQDMEALVVQQEPAVAQIETKGEETAENVTKANEEIDKGVELARARNRKKRWCLIISILIVLIIAAIIAVVVVVTNNNKKRVQP